MTIRELIDELLQNTPDAKVYFSFGDCVPTTIDSWRGAYSEPALGWAPSGYSGDGKAPTVAALIEKLEKAVGPYSHYHGWKGGEFQFTDNQTLRIDNPGDSTDTVVDRVEDRDWLVMIHTHNKKH